MGFEARPSDKKETGMGQRSNAKGDTITRPFKVFHVSFAEA